MKFASHEGVGARTLAYTNLPSAKKSGAYAAPGWFADGVQTVPGSTASDNGNGPSESGRGSHSGASTVTYGRGQEIFTPGQGHGLVYIVRSGCVRLYKVLADGRSINLGLLGPNTVFTQEDTTDGIASGSVAEAMVDSTIAVVDTDSLASIIADSPDLAAAMVTGMSRRLTELQTLVEQLLVRDTAVRLATTLLALANRFGRPTADGMIAIALPVTHQSLAGMIGSNRVTVTRKLIELQEGGYVRSLGRNAIAVSPNKLREYAQVARERDNVDTDW